MCSVFVDFAREDDTEHRLIEVVFECYMFVDFTREGATEHRLVKLVQCLCVPCL